MPKLSAKWFFSNLLPKQPHFWHYLCVCMLFVFDPSLLVPFSYGLFLPQGGNFRVEQWHNTTLCENKGTYSTFPHSTHPLFFHASWTKTQTKVGNTDILMHVSLAYNEHKCIRNARHLKHQN